MECHTQSFVPASWQARLNRFVSMDLQQPIVQHQHGQKQCPQMIPFGILFHTMSQHFRRCMAQFQWYPQLVIKWRQSRFFLNSVTGNKEQWKRTGTYWIHHMVHKNIRVSYVAAKVTTLQNATIHLCHLSSWNMKKEHENIYMDWKLLKLYVRGLCNGKY